jgi:hypothetical protein
VLPYRHETRRSVLVGSSSHNFVGDHSFIYDGVRCGYVGATRSRSGTGGLAYSPECVEGEFSEVRLGHAEDGVVAASASSSFAGSSRSRCCS